MRGVTWARAAATRLAAPGMATRRPLSIASTATFATSAASTHMTLGSADSASSLREPGPLAEAGVHRPRAQRGRGDARAAELAGQALGVGQHERLAGAVARLPGQGLERRRAGDVEDRPAAALDHARQEPAAEVDDGDDVDLDHPDLGLGVGLRDRAERGEAGVVDQDVAGEAELGDPVEQAGAGWGGRRGRR